MAAADATFGAPSAFSSLSREAVEIACAHCGLPVPAGLVEPAADAQFCCAGCHTAFRILHENGLARYYDFDERRDTAVRPSGRSFDEFDHPTFHELYVAPAGDARLSKVELYLEGVHCASCVWLVERVPLLVTGVARAELDVRRALATIVWDPSAVPLSRVARALDSLGYPPHPFRGVERETIRRREDRAMLVRIGVAGAIAVNVMLAALALYSAWFGGMEREYERLFRWISLVLVTIAVAWPGRVFFASAVGALRARALHIDIPIALGLAAAFAMGAWNTVFDRGPIYFDGVATLIFVLLVGRFLQLRGQRAAADSSELLYSLMPSSARVVGGDGGIAEVPAQALLPGMRVAVRVGETLPADGVVDEGRSQLDLSLLTGESRPVTVAAGERVFAGTVNLGAAITVRVERPAEESRVAGIMRQVEESARRRAPIVLTANRVAGWFVATVLVLAAATFLVWLGRAPDRALDNAVALLIVTCPCALAMSTPLAITTAIGRAARMGIFIKGGDVVEALSRPGQLLLDKTGTITESRTSLEHWTGPAWTRALVLALEGESSHPIAAGFRRAWADVAPAVATETTHVVGGGIEGIVDGHRVIVGSPAFVAQRLGESLHPSMPGDGAAVLTPVLVAVDGRVVGEAGFGDPVRADAAAAVDSLRRRGWRIGILSGDIPSVVRDVGRAVDVPMDACTGSASPEDKLAAIERARRDGHVVMVGDGINDAAAMAAATVGVGVHGGAEACLASADVYLTTPGLAPLVRLMDGASRTMRVVRRNIALSLAYNVVGAGLAMSGHLTPLVAAILMPASSLTVVLTSWRGRTFAERGPAT